MTEAQIDILARIEALIEELHNLKEENIELRNKVAEFTASPAPVFDEDSAVIDARLDEMFPTEVHDVETLPGMPGNPQPSDLGDRERLMRLARMVFGIGVLCLLCAAGAGAQTRELGIRSIFYDRSFNAQYNNEAFGWTDNLGVTQEMTDAGFSTCAIWMDSVPYNPGFHDGATWVDGGPPPGGEDMRRFWEETECEQIIVRFHAWVRPNENGCNEHEEAPLWFVMARLYEYAWWKDLTVIFDKWEQDWYPRGCAPCSKLEGCCPDGGFPCTWDQKRIEYMDRLDRLMSYESSRQQKIEMMRGRLERLYPEARLEVLNSISVNKFTGFNIEAEWLEGLPTVADMIPEMQYPPDLVSLTYYDVPAESIEEVIDWVTVTTGYETDRLFVTEFGCRDYQQPECFVEHLPRFWDAGIETVVLWVLRESWPVEISYELSPFSMYVALLLEDFPLVARPLIKSGVLERVGW